MITELRDAIHLNAKTKGFWESDNIPEKLMLVVSELSEALEVLRKDSIVKPAYIDRAIEMIINDRPSDEFKAYFENTIKDTFQDEIADAIIRLLDICGYFHIDIENHIRLKMQYNALRPYKHNKKF